MMHPEKWYQRRLAKYFTENYEHYEDEAEYFVDPAPNQWLFDLPGFGLRVELTCDENGAVTEQRYSDGRHERWCRRRLHNYMVDHYEALEDSGEIEWYDDLTPNIWRFDIPARGLQVTLTCDIAGHVTETQKPIKGSGLR